MKLTTYLLFLLSTLFIACDHDLALINENPSTLNDVEFRYLLPVALSSTYQNKGGITSISAGFVSQYFNADACVDIIYSRDLMDGYWKFSMYGGAMNNCQTILNKAEASGGGDFYSGVSKILMAHNFGSETTMFGDLPFSEALNPSQTLYPKYDSQEDIYMEILNLLDEAIIDLSQEDLEYAGGDLVFDGNTEKWIRNAKALKMRYLLHLSKKDPAYFTQILELANGAIQIAEEQAILKFENNANANWALNKWIVERPGFFYVHDYFITMMENGNDPRKAKNINVEQNSYFSFSQNGNNEVVWVRPDAEVPLLSLMEVYFIQAEVMLRLGDSKAAIESVLRNAVLESMRLMEVQSEDYEDYVNNMTKLDPDNSFEEDLEIIITEAYKAYFAFNSKEAWVNYRRTGFPILAAPEMMQSIWNPSGGEVQRFLYPQSEFDTNKDQVEKALLNQDGAMLDIPLWIFK